jgi:hypothetical protein
MGNNAAFTAFEASVIPVYNRGVLDRELLSDLMEPYRDCDIDSGGMVGTLTKDGLDIYEVVIKTFGHDVPKKPDLPKNYREWTPEQDAANEAYHNTIYELFHGITKQFGWC